MGSWGGIAATFQDIATQGVKDPYATAGSEPVVSTWSQLALNLADTVSKVGVEALQNTLNPTLGRSFIGPKFSAEDTAAAIAAQNRSSPSTVIVLVGLALVGVLGFALLSRRR